MNFLGHAYFTDGDDEMLAGNLFGDYVKGNIDHKALPEGIKNGLRFHRKLDSLCDESQAYQKIKELPGSEYGLYKGIIADVFIDHLLSKYWEDVSMVSLDEFAAETYKRVARSRPYFPERFVRMFEFMEKDNWFLKNRELQTMINILKRIETRFNNGVILHPAVDALTRHEIDYKTNFFHFIHEMKSAVQSLPRH